jgi:hypothetical protein
MAAAGQLHSTATWVSTAPVVVCERRPNQCDQSQATIVPGADEVLPLNVQLSVAPPFVSVQVSDSSPGSSRRSSP